MKQPQDEHRFFFVDETGDPTFYAKGKKLLVGQEGAPEFSRSAFSAHQPQRQSDELYWICEPK